MSCNIRIPLQQIIDDVAAALSDGFIKTDNAVLTEAVLNEVTIRGDISVDTAARNALCAILQTCGITAIELEWLDRPTVADMVAVSEVVAGEVVVSWKDLDTLITKGIVGKVQTTDVLDSLGVSQEEINTDIRNELDALPFEGGVLADTLVTATSNNGTVPRTQSEINAEVVSIKSYGAIGDGTLHTVEEWTVIGSRIYYESLAAIQVDYPHVTALTDSIDWAATQKCVNIADKVYCPKGKYVTNRVIKTRHDITPRNIGTSAKAVNIFGDGAQTVFTRNDQRPTTRIFTPDLKSTTQESDTANWQEAVFAVHCPHTVIEKLSIERSAIAIYFGQDFNIPFTSWSNVSYSVINDVKINRCGTGVLFLAVGGNHYVRLRDISFFACQIDVHKRSSYWWKVTQGRGDNNNNRHTYQNIRSDSSRVGYWNDCGDTATFYSWHGENCSSATTQNPFPTPDGLPEDMVDKSGVKKNSAVFIFTVNTQYNKMFGCHAENCEWDLYSGSYKNSFFGNTFATSKSNFIREPEQFYGLFTNFGGGIARYDNADSAVTKTNNRAGVTYVGVGSSLGTEIVSNIVRHKPVGSTSGGTAESSQIEFGLVEKNVELIIPIWGDTGIKNTIGNINIDVIAASKVVGQISSFSARATISALKTQVGTVDHYSMSVQHSFRSWYDRHLINVYKTVPGEPVAEGEPANPDVVTEVASHAMRLSIRPDPANGKTLQLVITCPFELTNGTIFVDRKSANRVP